METYRTVVVVAAVCCAASGALATAQEKSWVGEMVLPTKRTKDIKLTDRIDGKEVEFPYNGIFPIKVREERDSRLRIHDGHHEGWVNKADFVLGRDGPAYFHRRVQANPKDTYALYMRAAGWLQKGEPDNAILDLNDCIRLDPTDASAYNSRGNAYSFKKERDKAIQDYDEAIRLDPKHMLAFNNRGRAYHAQEEYDKAISDYSTAIRLDPTYVPFLADRALTWRAKKDYDKAITDYNEVLRRDPENVAALAYRGLSWSGKGEHARAVKDCDEAISLAPKYAWAHHIRATALMLLRRPDAAAGFQQVIDLERGKGGLSPYAAIMGYFTLRHADDNAGAKKFLKDSAAKLDQVWPYPVVKFLRGEVDEPALLKLATDNDMQTVARCFLGMDHAVNGRTDQALAHLRWVKDNGSRTWVQYTVSVAELSRLGQR